MTDSLGCESPLFHLLLALGRFQECSQFGDYPSHFRLWGRSHGLIFDFTDTENKTPVLYYHLFSCMLCQCDQDAHAVARSVSTIPQFAALRAPHLVSILLCCARP